MLPERRSGATLAAALACSIQPRQRAGLRSFPRAASCRMSLSSVKSETTLRSRLFSSSRFPCSLFSPSNSWRHRRHLAHPDLTDCVHHVPARPEHRPPQLRNDLFNACIASSLMSKTYLKLDHFNGGRSLPQPLIFSLRHSGYKVRDRYKVRDLFCVSQNASSRGTAFVTLG
jgi:hypothetical protein